MLEILISSSVLILVLAILRLVLRNRISARLQYALWLLVLVRLLVPVSFFHSSISVAEAAAPVTEQAWSASHMVLYSWNTPGSAPPESAGVATRLDAGGVINSGQVLLLRDALLFVWYLGVAVMAAWFLIVNVRLARRLRRNRTPFDYNSVMPVYVAEGIPSPCLFGLLRPSIYLTERAAEDDTRARQIIAHELTHYRHGDMIWSLLRSVCLVVWWFNPFVWLAAALSRQDCELACDEGTIKALGEEARFDYGRTLVGMAKVGARPSDLLCGATTMTTGKKSLKERVARIANAPKMSVTVAVMVLIIAAVAVGCTFSGAAEKAPSEPEFAFEPATGTASASDSEEEPKSYSVSIHDPESGEIRMIEPTFSGEFQDLYALYTDLKTLAHPMELSDVFSDDVSSYSVCFYKSEDAGFTSSNFVAGFDVWEDGMFLLYGGNSSTPPGVYQSQMFAEAFLDILDEYHSESAEAVFVSDEIIGTYDRAYWEEVDRELAGFAYPADMEWYASDDFDTAIPEDSIFGPMTVEDYIYGTDSWRFEYDSEFTAVDHQPYAGIRLYDADGRTLWIDDAADALMIEELDGSVTRVTYAGEPVDCADMIRHLLPWARGEYPPEDELAAQREEAMKTSVENAIKSLGYFALPGLEPVNREGGYAYPSWIELGDPRNPTGPYVALYFGTDEMSADLRYERVYWYGDPAQPLGAGGYAICRDFFAASGAVTDVKVDGMNGFVSEGGVYYGPRLVWYDGDNDLLFSLIAHHCDGGQPMGGYSPEELIALGESVYP